MKRANIRGVLFDLDGTFIDSSPGMARAANALREMQGLAPLPAETLRAGINRGARGMLQLALELNANHAEYALWRDRFYETYARELSGGAAWMPGVQELVAALQDRSLVWGIVTNKASRFAVPICAELGISARAACLVCGDTTPHTKPHPAPLLHAATLCGVPPDTCVYVGDDRRDIEAARVAGMGAIAAGYGFLAEGDSAQAWGADAVIDTPSGLIPFLE